MATDIDSEPSTSTSVRWIQPCRQFQFQEIQLATDDFDESLVIGRGGFGKVYKGTIYDGSTPVDAAIKRLDSSSGQGAPEFWAEVETLSKLRHCHLVSLLGYCNHGKEMILVYEYMPNGTLGDHLHKLGTPLSWLQRLNICIGAARGLDYLHTGTGVEFGVIHRDVKSSNVLLNESWAAKISDFGLSRMAPTNKTLSGVETLVRGTFGYFDPEYYCTGRLTRKSDVYAFGVVLLEVLCRKRAVDTSLGEDQPNLARWVQESIKEGKLKHIIDYDITVEISPKCLKEFVGVAKRCLVSNSKERPTMAEVVVGLKSALTIQEKINSSMHSASRTIFGRMFDKFPFPSKGENSASAQGDSSASSNAMRNNANEDNKIPILEEFKFPDLKEYKFDKFLFPSKEENSAQGDSKASGNAKRNSISKDKGIPILKKSKFLGPIEYKFDDLKRATSNFSEDLMWRKDEYLGRFENNDTLGSTIQVIKRFHKGQGEEWVTVVNLLGQLDHPNIINLLGYCNRSKHKRFLVYEYMQNGSFDHHLHGETADRNLYKTLSWGTRLAIMIGVARGLAYLHSFDIVHRDVNCFSILLDQDFNAKLADFECAKVLSPAYLETSRLNVKSDIYNFGVLLLETLTGCWVFEYGRPMKQEYLTTWARPYLEEMSKLKEIMDPRLEGNYPLEGAFECAALARSCLVGEPRDRPSSEEVLRRLEEIHTVHK